MTGTWKLFHRKIQTKSYVYERGKNYFPQHPQSPYHEQLHQWNLKWSQWSSLSYYLHLSISFFFYSWLHCIIFSKMLLYPFLSLSSPHSFTNIYNMHYVQDNELLMSGKNIPQYITCPNLWNSNIMQGHQKLIFEQTYADLLNIQTLQKCPVGRHYKGQ